jgi:outer membrane protein OmpA-like peptidoglycan-associated protein
MPCAVLVLSLLGAGCANIGLGTKGYDAFRDGNYPEAEGYFSADYKNHPAHPLTQFNLADSYRQRGQSEQANVLYRQAAAGGKDFRPDRFLEPHDSTTTVRDVACRYLAQDQKSDQNCPNLQAETTPPLPNRIAEASPPPRPTEYVAEASPPAQAPEYVKTFVVFFDFNKSSLTADARGIVAEAVRMAKLTGPVRIVVTGHTDMVGSNRYNQALSERRAMSIKGEMDRLGLDGVVILTTGKSFSEPLVTADPGVREPQNRRAVIDLTNPPIAGNF